MNIDVDIVGQYSMLFVCYAVTIKSDFWVVKGKHQIPNLKEGFEGLWKWLLNVNS